MAYFGVSAPEAELTAEVDATEDAMAAGEGRERRNE